ncbi:MAG: GNAT family N-acetyltransferase [Acidimicrobiales bacterium]
MVVEKATEVTEELLDALARLLPQLSSTPISPRPEEVEEILASGATSLFVARCGRSQIMGMLTLAIFRAPTGVRAWIEDVVVDGQARGSGIGKALVAAALEQASTMEARTVDLTSRPSRDAANRLYLRLGFQPRETNVYRYHVVAGEATRERVAGPLTQADGR